MLQPRLTGCGGEMGYRNRMLPKWSLVVCAAVLLSTTLVTCQDVNDDELIESSRIKREGVPDNRDLTVLLVNEKRNDYNTKIGRYHSVKPLIGLLTSTARTFIQDGVTTEFATQILGTTLDNGRIYAQLLTKSSLVLYNKPSNVDDPIIVRPTRVHSVFDGGWNVKQDLGFIDPEKFVLKNTDYLAPSSKMNIVYASKPVQDNIKYWSLPSAPDNQVENQIFDEPIARRVQPVKEIPRYVQNEAFNYLDGPIIEAEKKYEFYVEPSNVGNVHVPHRQSKAYEPVTEPFITEKLVETLTEEPNVVKVKPDYDLPTFTIKNEFSPIFYYIDNVESRKPLQPAVQQTKLPKKLFGQKSEPRPKTTFTYEGFADFTTIVGDTVIIFTPNTETIRPPNPDEVNVYPSAKRVETLATKITFLSADIPVATSTYKAHESISPTKVGTPSSVEENTSEQPIYNDEESLKKLMYEVNDKDLSPVNIQQNSEFGLNVDVIQPSESTITTTESTRITDNLGVIPIQDSSSQPTEPLIPSSTSTEITKESAVTESNMSELFTNSEEESDNTAAEVTEKNEEEEIEEEEEEKPTEIITTTESGHSDESSEEIESTTESKIFTTEHDDDEDDDSSENINKDGNNSDNTNNNNFRNDNVYHDDSDSDNFENDGIEHETHEDVFCTDGLETQSTMTTAYKTLTYLTTYFIPLESTETTTSVKSDVVVESNVGYYTNVVCRTSFDIEPTAVISVDVNYSVQTNIEVPQSAQEETTEMPIIESEPSTENPKTTESYKTTIEDNETLTTVQEENAEDNKQTTVGVNVDNESKESVELQEPTTSLTTTTEAATTSQGHVEVSVSTEHTTTTTSTEKPVAIEENIEDEENEIDVIYKTLYTTYTYFTTFFGDQTSSVASHKSVVTNVITSTIDLSNLDPSLLGAFEESEIAPTKVGIDGSTESVAINSIIDLVKNKDVIESVEVDDIYSSQTPTPALGDDLIASIKPDAVKTYYTTYTFFTTIFVGSDANVCSRSEIYTNYVGPDELIPTKSNPLTVESTRAQFDFRNCKQVKVEPNVEENSSMETSVTIEQQNINDYNKDQVQPSPIEVDMLFSVESNPLESENSYVTDVKSSSSKGDRKFLDSNYILDDQISSESNIDEIMPSPTLLLQTSYTTFTYFTTMYIGKDSSKVKSHLETITNVVTETITPNKEAEDESSLPITYYTTFTYWTTLYKDKTTTITSREEIVSNVVTPSIQSVPTISPIDTKPIEVDSLLPPKELEAEIKPSLLYDKPEQDDGKATYFTTYTYFTTFYAGNTSQVRSSLETVTNIVENTKNIEDNQIARKVPEGSPDKNLIQDNGEKPLINPTVIKEVIETTKVPDIASASPTVLLGTYIDNLFAEVKPISPPPEGEKKILFSQVAVISGDSTIVTSDNKTLNTNANATTSTTTTTENAIISSSPDIIESSFTETETTTESKLEEEDDGTSTRKKSRLTFKPKKPSITPVITPFLSRNRPTFIPKRVPLSNSATTITRLDVTPTITATPTLKSVRQSGFAGNRKQPAAQPAVSSTGKRFSGRSSVGNLSANTPSASRPGGFGRASVQPTSRRGGFRSSSLRSNSLDYISRSATARLIRPTASLRLPPGRSSRQFASITFPPQDQNEETFGTQQDETVTESLDEFNESPIRTTTNNPLLKFRRPPITRQPGTAITPRSTTQSARRGGIITRGRTTTTTKRSTSRATTNPLLLLRRERPNSLFPRRNLFKQPDPEPEEEIIKEDEQNGEDDEELLEEEDFEVDNDYGSSDRKERQVSNPTTQFPKKTNVVQIRPFAFKRRTKRQADYSNRKYTNFRRPGLKTASTRRPEPEPETEAPHTQKPRPGGRFNSRIAGNSRSTTSSAPKAPARQSFIVRGESRTTTTTTTSAPAYRRGKSRAPSRTTTSASRPKAPRLSGKSSTARSSTSRSTARSRTRTTTSRASSKQRNSFENLSAERFNYNNILNDGKITVTHQIPTEVTVPIVNGKITEYKNLLSATQSIETLLLNQVSSSIGPLGNPQLVLAAESTELAENGATKIIKFLLHETPTTTVVFTPTTIRGRKTSFSHILPSTVYNVEAVTQTVAPEINNNVPLANLLLSQLLLGNQQPAINPLLAFQGQGLLPQQPIVQTPVTEYKTRTTTYVTTVTDARETVLPITFKGRAILTTIVDPTTNVITATEYVTDTVVTTPTALAPAPQLNSLLLPLLLQQQQQQQQALSLQTVNPLLQLGTHDLNINSLNNLSPLQNNLNNDIYSNSPKPNILSDLNSNEDFSEDEPENIEEDEPPPPPPTRSRTRHRAPKPPPAPPSPPKLTSIVTLYVSGKHPGEFSTVLSTVVSDDTQTVRKREAIYYEDVKVSPSVLPTVTELYGSHSDNTLAVSETERYLDTSIDNQIETQSLESIVGEISKHIRYETSPTYVFDLGSPSSIRHIKQSSVDDISSFNTHSIIFDNTPWRPGSHEGGIERALSEDDERKIKNVATRIMSNGVEVLVRDKNADGKQEQTKYMEVKTIQPTSPTGIFMSNYQKADKRTDKEEDSSSFDIIQPSEVSHIPCTTSCSCSHSKTDSLKTNYGNIDATKTTNYGTTVLDLRPTNKETLEKKTNYGPYEFEGSTQLAPTDKIVEKYTQVINDYSDEKESNAIVESELLTNEQAPTPSKTTKVNNKTPEKNKPEKIQKPNKNKFVVADLLKLGTLGIKSLTQLAPVIEKMTGGFIKRQEAAAKTTTTTLKPVEKLTAYNVNNRIDSNLETKHNNFPIYIPVDELETSESQFIFTNATLHQSLAWAAEHKQSKSPPKVIHESPLVNGGIPISPGEIITTNSDVIVGKPAVGGPFTLVASGIKLQNPVNPPAIDSMVSANEHFLLNEKPLNDQFFDNSKVDDSFDLRPPNLPSMKTKPILPNIINQQRPTITNYNYQNKIPYRKPSTLQTPVDHWVKTDSMKSSNTVLSNHGRPVFLDYIPSLVKPTSNNKTPLKHHVELKPTNNPHSDIEIADNSPSSSEIVNTQIKTDDEYTITESAELNKPFLVDIQPSRVANVLIPHGSSTAIVFAGSSEPHKTGDYVDDPLPYPEPGYFGSFSIDAPQMTNVHNVAPNNKNVFNKPNIKIPRESYSPDISSYKLEQPSTDDHNSKWKEYNRHTESNKIPSPTSNQETHVQVGPQITAYNPEVFSPTNSEYDKYSKDKDNTNDDKKVIDKEYENYLAVPPPPPKMLFNPDSPYDQSKPYSQRPIVHTKPVQDMKVFLNIQHPVPKEKTPQKVTSEIYFAAQAPNNKVTPTYTFHIPSPPLASTHNKYLSNNIQSPHSTATNVGNTYGHYSISSSPNNVNNSLMAHGINDKSKIYAVTLNTATNVAGNIGEGGQIIGSSVQIPINSSLNMGLNTDIPIPTNFAIKVDDSIEPFETYNLQGSKTPIIYDEHGRVPIEVSVGDNRWNKSTSDKVETTIVGHNYYNEFVEKPIFNNPLTPSSPSSTNSHANFPMTNEDTKSKDVIIEYTSDVKTNEQKRPAKLIPNIPTNSNGWYSSVLNENNINNIKHVESTTRKNIPLLHEYNEKDHLPNFGHKIESAGKPPSDFWSQHPQRVTGFNIGKPFTKPISTEKPFSSIRPFTIKPYNHDYIPSNIGVTKPPPAYIIPIRDNNNKITTVKAIRHSTQRPKPVYENSEEIYDGEEESDSTYDNDGEVSLESMKVPVVTTSNEINGSTSSELTLLQEEVLNSDKTNKGVFISGIQTEKPFGMFGVLNKTIYHTSTTKKPIYENNSYNMKPRPFTINTAAVLDHQLQQPHWQINQMMENDTNASYEDNIELNTGEEFNKPIISSSTISPSHHKQLTSKPNLPPEPVLTRLNSTHVVNDSNIITSTVHIKDKKPLIVEKDTEKPTLTTLEISTDVEINQTSSEIIDLSPPPPTLDNNFKSSTNNEMIMGMSPPPPRISSNVRPPIRISHTPRPIPVRNPPLYRPKPQRTLPPRYQTQKPLRKQTIKDDISTYRPVNKDEISGYKPLKKEELSTFKPNSKDNVSTYRPAYNILNNIRRPTFNRDQPSSQLLPPPRDLPSKVISFNDIPSPTIKPPSIPKIVFPTPISSGWLTSSDIDYYSSFNFAPSSIRFPESHPSELSVIGSMPDVSSENSYSYEVEYSSELSSEISSEKPLTGNSKENEDKESTQNIALSNEANFSDSNGYDSSENISTNKMVLSTLNNKNRTRKPYPVRHNDMKPNTSKFKMPPKATVIIAPTRTLSRPETLSPTRHVSIKKIVRPVNTRVPDIIEGTIIESSEIYGVEDFIKPTQVLNVESTSEIILSSGTENLSNIIIKPTIKEIQPIIQSTHHAGNEVKISDEIIPTKTEFRTTVVTHTKTLSEPPKTVSSIGFVNLTHTLTVTHTQTSLISQSEGAVTETLILTNTQTSTIVDVVTEIHTQVQPTTIIETVTKHVPVPTVEPTPVLQTPSKTKAPLDDITMSSEESDNFIIKDNKGSENVQKIDNEADTDNDSFFVVLNKSQNGGHPPTVNTEVETGDFDGITRNEQVNNNGVSQVLFGEILLAGAPYLETTNVGTASILNISAVTYGKECQPDCKASRNERCQRIDSIMKCVCRPGFARMFPDRPCKPTYTYSVKLALGTQGNESLKFHKNLLDNSSKEYQSLAGATHEGINRMVMQSDLRDVYHGVHINGFHPVEMKTAGGDSYQGVINDFYVQLSDNAHESRLKEVIEKYLRNNNYSLGGTDVLAAGEFMDQLDVSDFDECTSGHFHDCSEHAQCFNLRGTYTCSCLEGYADLSVNNLYPGRICSAEPVGCEKCNYHGTCYSRDDRRMLCECFQWYTGSTCQINLKVVLISLVVLGALLTLVLTACAVLACRRTRPPQRSIVACIQSMPTLHQGAMPSKQRADRRALISERGDTGDASSVQNASLPYIPAKRPSSTKKIIMSDPPAHDPPPPPPAPAVMIPRARLHPHHEDSRENLARKRSLELSSEAKLISYLESGATVSNNEMRRKHSLESSYSANKDRHNKQGALVSAGFKVSTTVRADESAMKEDRDDLSSVNKADLEADLARFDSLRKAYSHEDLSEWTDAERRLGELTLSEARSIGGTLPASTGRAASSTRLTHQEANTMAERDLGSTFLLPHVHLYKPDLTSDVSEFDSL